MNIDTLMDTLKSALAEDDDLTTWARTTYGRDHKVYVNLDVRNPPADSDCPYVAIYPEAKTVGYAVSRRRHILTAICCIHDETSEINAENTIIEYKGVGRLEAFRKLVEDAAAGMDIGNALFDTVDVEYDTIESFPFMMCGMGLTIGEDVLMASDPLE